MIIDFAEASSETIYRILIGSVLPRPIAWVSTTDSNGVFNLAPFSFFTVASANPPVLCFSPGMKQVIVDGVKTTVPKDTLRNVRETKEFVVNIVSHSIAEKMNLTSGEFPPDVSEFAQAGLTPVKSSLVKAPRVGESLINFECELHQIVEFGQHAGAGSLVLGRIKCVHIDDAVYTGGHIDLDVLQPIGRLGGYQYCTVRDQFEMVRPKIGRK